MQGKQILGKNLIRAKCKLSRSSRRETSLNGEDAETPGVGKVKIYKRWNRLKFSNVKITRYVALPRRRLPTGKEGSLWQ